MVKKMFQSIEVFGEVLFDVFDCGEKIIGGAPFNVACHLVGLGSGVTFISRVGSDQLGRKVIVEMDARSISTDFMQFDRYKPTGEVRVSLGNGEPQYEIKEDSAFDYIEFPENIVEGRGEEKLFYHGTLAARNGISFSTLESLARRNNQKIFCDLNLREPFWSPELIKRVVSWSSFLKVNEEELKHIADILGVCKKGILKKAELVLGKINVQTLIVTMGCKGAAILDRDDGCVFLPVSESEDLDNQEVNTVGAGDSFSAVVLLGIKKGWSWHDILKKAILVSHKVCCIKGAIPKKSQQKSFYGDLIKKLGS